MVEKVFPATEKSLNNTYRPKVQADLKILRFLQNQGQIMFLIPRTSKHKTFFVVTSIICGVALLPIAYKLLTLRFDFFLELPMTCLIMDILNYFTGYICLAVFCISQNFYHDNWKKMENIVTKTEKLLTATKFVVTKENFFWKYGLMHVIYFLAHGWQIFRWIKRNHIDLTLSYLGFRIVHYWATFTSLLIYQWLVFLSKRYVYLDKYTKYVFSKRVIVVHQVIKDLQMAGEIYKNLTAISHELNTLFSIHLFFLIFMTILMTLHGFSFAILLMCNLSTCMQAIMYVALFFINMLALVVSYEKLRENSRNIIKTCLFLQEEMEQKELRKELSLLTKYLKKLKPKMSAIGFFEMDFQLIAGYISIVFAYLIIILQFNNTFI